MNTEATRLFFHIMNLAQQVHNTNMRTGAPKLEYMQILAQEIKEKAQEILDL